MGGGKRGAGGIIFRPTKKKKKLLKGSTYPLATARCLLQPFLVVGLWGAAASSRMYG